MPPRLKRFVLSWIINTFAVAVAGAVVRGIHYDRIPDLIVASFLLGMLNSFLRPILMLLALPLLIFTLGLFLLVINGVLLYFVGFMLQPHFYVDGFWPAFKGALIISIVSLVLNSLTGSGGSRVEFRRGGRPQDPDRGGNGPVIDI